MLLPLARFAQVNEGDVRPADQRHRLRRNAQEGTSAFAQALPGLDPAPARSVRATGIFENLPADVNPYAYHENLEASQANYCVPSCSSEGPASLAGPS